MKIEADLYERLIEELIKCDELFTERLMVGQLKELRSLIISDAYWDTDDKQADLEAIKRVLAWYDCGT